MRATVQDIADPVDMYADYYPYGSIARSAGSPSRFGFQGEYAEDEMEERGVVAFELRDWNPIVGRWLSMDPKRIGFSPYIGMSNNPVSTIDPDGGAPLNDYNVDESGDIVSIDVTTDNFDRIVQNGEEIYRTAEGTFLQDFTSVFDGILSNTEITFTRLASQINNKYSSKFGGWAGKAYDRLKAFNDNVTDGAVFDLKAHGMGLNELGLYSIYDNKIFRYDDYGNYNYGVAARAFGFNQFTAEFGAGINQLSKGFEFAPIKSGDLRGFPTIIRSRNPLGPPSTYFDDRRDNRAIINGYNR